MDYITKINKLLQPRLPRMKTWESTINGLQYRKWFSAFATNWFILCSFRR